MASISPVFGSAYWASATSSHPSAGHDRGVAAVGRGPGRRPDWAQGELGDCELGGGASSVCVARSFSGLPSALREIWVLPDRSSTRPLS